MAVRICVAGVTGWTGSAIAGSVLDSSEFQLVGAVARRAEGQDAGTAIGRDPCGVVVSGSVEDALGSPADVLIDYTHPDAVRGNVLAALGGGVGAVIGTSGLTAEDYREVDGLARASGVGVIAAGNFSLTAALAKRFAGMAARHIPHWEIIDYASGDKPDSPSGTARELAEYLGSLSKNEFERPLHETLGDRGARGATIGGAQVHSIRLPSFVLSFEAVFGLPNERLSIRHDAGSGADPYVGGTLLAARRVMETKGLILGLDTLLFGSSE